MPKNLRCHRDTRWPIGLFIAASAVVVVLTALPRACEQPAPSRDESESLSQAGSGEAATQLPVPPVESTPLVLEGTGGELASVPPPPTRPVVPGLDAQPVRTHEQADPSLYRTPLPNGFTIDVSQAHLDEALGRLVQVSEDGVTIVLTLDPALQAHLMNVVSRYDEPAESVVALDPITGRVLAWVQDTSQQSPSEHPASSALPYAASVFKIVTAAALIESAGVEVSDTVCVSNGRSSVQPDDLTPDLARDTRCVDMIEAMAESVNVYFARQVDSHLSAGEMTSWLERFAFNERIPFELELEESVASVPEDRLERARMAAGFRHATLSPLHGALMVSAIANGGQMMEPTLVEEIRNPDGEVIYSHQPRLFRRVMSSGTARSLTDVLSQTAITGTASRYFSDREGWPADLHVAGKTGTLSNRSPEGQQPDPLLIFTWFVGFAPIEDPNIAVAALVYNTERWHIKGSYLASEAIVHYHLYGP